MAGTASEWIKVEIQITDAKGEVLDIPKDEQGRPNFQAMFQDWLVDYEKVAFVGHPKSAGMGLTLTASPVVIYYSNDFDMEARVQSEDRIHRIGLDMNRGATIIDLIHLSSDLKVLENLQKKRDLQSLSLGEFKMALESQEERKQ